jgi:sigma-E factor negative regulatory protein RseA
MKERLSQLLDGELSEFERHRALRDLEGSGELRSAWERYHLIGAALRKELSSAGHCRIAERVAARLHGESVSAGAFTPAGTSMGLRRAARWIGGFAVAATVATVAILNWAPVAPTSPDPSQVASAPPTASPVTPQVEPVAVASNEGPAAATSVGAAKDAQQERTNLDPYLVQHSEASAATGAWRPYVRVVSHPSDQ